MTFLKLLRPCKKEKSNVFNRYIHFLSCRICELKPTFANNWPQAFQGRSSFINFLTFSSILAVLKTFKTVALACTFWPKISSTKAR